MLAPDAKPAALGDGWLRLMRFDLSAAVPTIAVSTYSTHFHSSSERMPTYAALYRPHEQPTMSDPAFLGAENFTLRLEIGRAHVRTPVTNAHLVCRLLLEKKKNQNK